MKISDKLIEKYGFLVLADRISDLKKKYPQLSEKIDYLAEQDPSGNQKYLEYAVKVLVSGQALENEIADVIKLFHKYSPRLEKKDINSYQSFTDLRDLLFGMRDIKTTKEKKEIKTSGAEKKYEDDQVLMVRVKDKGAACFYGAGTKWCITMSGRHYFEDYDAANVLFYFILRKDLPQEDPLYKVAAAVQRDQENNVLEIQYFDAADSQIAEDTATVGLKSWGKIKSIIDSEASKVPKGILAKLAGPEINEISLEEIKKYIESAADPEKIMYIIIQNKHSNENIINFLVDMAEKEPALYDPEYIFRHISLFRSVSLSVFKKIKNNPEINLVNIQERILDNKLTLSELLKEIAKDDLMYNSNNFIKLLIEHPHNNQEITDIIANKILQQNFPIDSKIEDLFVLLTGKYADSELIKKILSMAPEKLNKRIIEDIYQFHGSSKVFNNDNLINFMVDNDRQYKDVMEIIASKVKQLTAENWNKLADNSNSTVRYYLASNKNIPENIVDKLMNEKSSIVYNLVRNISIPEVKRRQIFQLNKDNFNEYDLENLKEYYPELTNTYKDYLKESSANIKIKLINKYSKSSKKLSKEKIPLAIIKKLPYKTLNRMIDKLREFLKKDGVVQEMFNEYGVDINEIDYVPMRFGDIEVSAKTDHACIIFNYKLLTDGDFFKDFSYGTHELSHYLQQSANDKPTTTPDDEDYLDSPYEQEAFQNQIEYIAKNFNENAAEEYVDNLLKHHQVKPKEKREEKKELLMSKI